MKKKYSLKRNEDIARIVHDHKFAKNDSYVMYYSFNQQEHTRVCISVSKKLGNAVVRNKIKRQVREMVTDTINFENKIDFVIIVRNRYLENEFSYNKEKLQELYFKIISKNKEKKINELKENI